MFGLSEKDWNLVETLCLGPLKQLGARVWIFGSRARSDHRPFSDLDILYALPPGLPPSGARKTLRSIKEALEESRLGMKVDLVNEAELAESFRGRVSAERVEI